MTIGENIKRVRRKNGLTQRQLGELCNPPIGDATIRKYELNILTPKIETIEKISNALQCPVNELRDVIKDGNENEKHVTYQDLEDACTSLYLEYINLIRKRIEMLSKVDKEDLDFDEYGTYLSEDIRTVNAIESAMARYRAD